MGATGWTYFVPYQPDINSALQALRQHVFERGEYYKLPRGGEMSDQEMEIIEDAIKQSPPWMQEMMRASLVSHAEYRNALPKPTTIEELLVWNEDSGTHSILDMTKGVGDSPALGKVAPLSEEALLKLFGTRQPDHSMVEDKADDLIELRERWQGTYVIVYKDGVPDEICFAGYSGD